MMNRMSWRLIAAGSVLSLAACGGDSDSPPPATNELPQLTPATGAQLRGTCPDLAAFNFMNTTITSATLVNQGTLRVAGKDIRAHCLVVGSMGSRVSTVDGQTYAIGFEMRLPVDWNGRYLYQGNGGADGVVATAIGSVGSGGPLTNALYNGFAVISSDAGHSNAQNPLFGLDPQARTDYGYGAVQKLTPFAKALIAQAYGKGPDRSYIGGSSNGGRHAMVAAARFANEYDGMLANSPGFNLPISAFGSIYTAQQWRKVATDVTDLSTAFTLAERRVVANAILTRCDALDGVADGLVQDIEACRPAFNIFQHVPTCSGARDGTCLTEAQKSAVDAGYAGPFNSRGVALYTTQPYDPGLVGSSWAQWKFVNPVGAGRGVVATRLIFQVPPDPNVVSDPPAYAFAYNFDVDPQKMFATDSVYTESAVSWATPPNPTKLDTLRNRGGKMIVVHGVSDGTFSIDDTKRWYDALDSENGGQAARFVRFFRVPGMNHSSGGVATEQYDALTALVDWVENGRAPDRIIATARGAGNAGGVNSELPAGWAADRTRPLCPYPLVARYNGTGDVERAENFTCRQ